MKVLIGLDDSTHAEITLDFVRKMPWPANTAMIIVSAVQPPIGAFSETYTPAAMDLGVWLDELTKLHEDVASRGAKSLGVAGLHAQTRVPQGDAREALIEEAKRERADLIVVGSHGRTGIEKLLMGSVATHVVNHAPCSVLVVRR